MIVISGALVLVALVLLVLGLTMTDLDFVYGSIGVSLVSFVFLLIGILQRRGEPSPAGTSADSPGSAVPGDTGEAAARGGAQFVPAVTVAKAPAKTGGTGPVPVVEGDLDDDELEPGGGPVLVVPGRPRYHVEGCRYLSGKSAEEVDVLDAREDGFTPCGVCKPDEVLEELYGEFDDQDVRDRAGDDEPAPAKASGRRTGSAAGATAALELGGSTSSRARAQTPAPAAEAPAKKAPAKKPAAKKPAAKQAPTKQAPAKKVPTKKAPARTAAAPRKAPAGTAPAQKAPAQKASTQKAPTQKAPAQKATAPQQVPTQAAAPATAATATPAPGRGKVVVIPDRDRFHTPSCRFVRGVQGTEELTRPQAGKQGYQPCGVCKP